MLKQVQHDGNRKHPETHHSQSEILLCHPEFISGSQGGKQMLKQVQHDGNRKHPETHHSQSEFPHRHPEFISGSQENKEMLNPVPHDDYSIGQASNPAQYDGWCRTSLSLGRSMIEMLGVLAIIGVLSIGGLYAYRQAMGRYKLNQTLDLINAIQLAFLEADYQSESTILTFPQTIEGNRKLMLLVCQNLSQEWCKKYNDAGYNVFPYGANASWSAFSDEKNGERVAGIRWTSGANGDATLCEAAVNYAWPNLKEMHVVGQSYDAVNGQLTGTQKKELIRRCGANRGGYFAIKWQP